MAGWVLFRADSFEHALGLLRAMAGLAPGDTTRWPVALYLGRDVQAALGVAILACLPVLPTLGRWWQRWRSAGLSPQGRVLDGLLQGGAVLSLLALLCACAVLLAAATHNPFIYFRF
jgi:hypothetical protein